MIEDGSRSAGHPAALRPAPRRRAASRVESAAQRPERSSPTSRSSTTVAQSNGPARRRNSRNLVAGGASKPTDRQRKKFLDATVRGSTHHAGAVRAGNRRRLLAPAAPHDSGRDGHARRRGEVPRHQRLRGGLLRRQYRGRRSGGAGRVGAGPVVNGQEMSPLARTAMSRVRTAMSRTWPAGHSSWLVRFVRRPGTHRGPGRWRSRANREGMGSGVPPIGYQRAPSSHRRCLASEPCSDSRRAVVLTSGRVDDSRRCCRATSPSP